jgi:vancomycin permeability regulator SanA
MINLDDRLIKDLTDFMFVDDQIINADLTIVLGQTLYQRPLQKALGIYLSGQAGKLIFSGGNNPRLHGAEAELMLGHWLALGYETKDILIDCLSVNTLENMVNAKAIAEDAGIYRHKLRINIVSINFHMRRAIETFRLVWGTNHILGAANYPSKYCDKKTWQSNTKGLELVISEYAKMVKYLNLNPLCIHGAISTLVSKS